MAAPRGQRAPRWCSKATEVEVPWAMVVFWGAGGGMREDLRFFAGGGAWRCSHSMHGSTGSAGVAEPKKLLGEMFTSHLAFSPYCSAQSTPKATPCLMLLPTETLQRAVG